MFALTGEFDTKVGLVVGQSFAPSATFSSRIFSNFSGWRPAEPTSVAAVAAVASLTELLLFLLHAFTVELSAAERADLLGLTLCRDNVRCLAEMRDTCVFRAVPEICLRSDGRSVVGLSARAAASSRLADWTAGKLPGAHENLVAVGHDWAARVAESWHATVFAAIYVFGTILFHFAPFNVVSVAIGCGAHPALFKRTTVLVLTRRSSRQAIHFTTCAVRPCKTHAGSHGADFSLLFSAKSASRCAIGFALRLVDVVLYIWIGWFFLLARRRAGGRPALARRGKRTILIADVPWVHQSVEIFVSKLFALSYGDNGVDVHGACPTDSLVHRFTHRVQRGCLVALGRPDGRVATLARAENACLLSAMQASASASRARSFDFYLTRIALVSPMLRRRPRDRVGRPQPVPRRKGRARGGRRAPGARPSRLTRCNHRSAHRSHGFARFPTQKVHRRPFMCEFVARAAVGFASRGAPDPSAVLALLGAGVVVPAEAMALAGASLTLCDRCATAPASKECGTCSSKMCLACDTEMHAKPKRAGHARLPLSVTLRLRLMARAARVRLLSRHSTKRIGDGGPADAGGAPPEAAAAGERRSGIVPSSTMHLSSLGADVGTAHNTFGFFAADVVLEARLRVMCEAMRRVSCV